MTEEYDAMLARAQVIFPLYQELEQTGDPERAIWLAGRILAVMPRADGPDIWAGVHLKLANAILSLPEGHPGAEIGRAIASLEAARPDAGPAADAFLVTAYLRRTDGDRAGDIERAIACGERALTARHLPRELLAFAGDFLGVAYLARLRGSPDGNARSAIRCLTTALELCGGAKAPPADARLREPWAQLQITLGRACAASPSGDPAGNLRLAMECFGRALAVCPRGEHPVDFALTHAQAAEALIGSGHAERSATIEAAIGHYEQAWQALLAISHREWPASWVAIVTRLAAAYLSRLEGDPQSNVLRAEWLLTGARQTLAMLPLLRNAPEELTTGEALRERGDARLLAMLGAAFASRHFRGSPEYAGRLEAAIECLTGARAAFDPVSSPVEWADATTGLAVACSDRVDGDRAANLRKAIGYLEEVLAARIGEGTLGPARILHDLGAVHADLADVTGAGEPEQAARARSEAARCFRAALGGFREYADRPSCRTTAWELAKVLADAGAWEESAGAYEEAAEAADGLYASALLQGAREAEIADAAGLYPEAGYALAKAGRCQDAAVMLERGRARVLSDALARDAADLDALGAARPELADAYREAARAVSALEARQRETAGQAGPLGGDAPAMTWPGHAGASALADQVRMAAARLDAIIGRIRAAGFGGLLARPVWADVAAAALPGHPLAYLSVSHRGGVILVVHAGDASGIAAGPGDRPSARAGVRAVFTGPAGDTLARALRDLIITLDHDGRATGGLIPTQREIRASAAPFQTALAAALRLAGTEVAAPLAAELARAGAGRVTLVASQDFGLLPLHAAPVGEGRLLLDVAEVGYAPSARVLRAARSAARDRDAAPPVLAAVADPDAGDLPALGFARAEAREAASHFPADGARVLSGADASCEGLERIASGATHVHLACHGMFDTGDPMASRLALAGGTGLTLRDILARRPFGRARLVVMSACQTGLADLGRLPDEVIGFPVGVLHGGTPGVIGTLWPVDDLATALVMARFYQYYLGERPERRQAPATALALAQRWLSQATRRQVLGFCRAHPALAGALASAPAPATRLNSMVPGAIPFADPYFWAAFVFVGA